MKTASCTKPLWRLSALLLLSIALIACRQHQAPARVTPDLQGAAADRAALIAFYNAAAGPNWHNRDNWLTDAPSVHWHGVETDSSGRVTMLVLQENGLEGTIPPELANLADLWLARNRLSGKIPAAQSETAADKATVRPYVAHNRQSDRNAGVLTIVSPSSKSISIRERIFGARLQTM